MVASGAGSLLVHADASKKELMSRAIRIEGRALILLNV